MRSPARKAPRATDSPMACVAAAVPRPTARAKSRKSSELRVWAARVMSGGNTLLERYQKGTRMRADLPRAAPRPRRRLVSSEPSSGVTTMRTTAARSSTRLMPISTRPCRECSSPRSMSSRASTMVLDTEITIPTMSPWRGGQPSAAPVPAPSPMVRRTASGAPRRATHRTRWRSRRENSIPTENIRRTTPISAKSSKLWTSLREGPGVNGLMRSPPTT